jgi:exosortase family protein XrtM
LDYPALQACLFLLIFASLQAIWLYTRDGIIGKVIIENVTVKFSVMLINLLTPSIGAFANNTHISAQGGGINVINGCEGVEVIFLLIAAMLVAPLTLKQKVLGLTLGIPYVYLLNQGRLIAMFYAVRSDKALFNMLHGTIAPVLLIGFTVLFFSYWLSRHPTSRSSVTPA